MRINIGSIKFFRTAATSILAVSLLSCGHNKAALGTNSQPTVVSADKRTAVFVRSHYIDIMEGTPWRTVGVIDANHFLIPRFEVGSVALSPDGSFLIAAAWVPDLGGIILGETEIQLWNVKERRLITRVSNLNENIVVPLRSTDFQFAPDSRSVVAPADGLLIINTTTGEIIRFPGRYFAYTNDGQYLSAIDTELTSTIKTWDVHNGRLQFEDKTALFPDSLQICPNQQCVIVRGSRSCDCTDARLINRVPTVAAWDMKSGKRIVEERLLSRVPKHTGQVRFELSSPSFTNPLAEWIRRTFTAPVSLPGGNISITYMREHMIRVTVDDVDQCQVGSLTAFVTSLQLGLNYMCVADYNPQPSVDVTVTPYGGKVADADLETQLGQWGVRPRQVKISGRPDGAISFKLIEAEVELLLSESTEHLGLGANANIKVVTTHGSDRVCGSPSDVRSAVRATQKSL